MLSASDKDRPLSGYWEPYRTCALTSLGPRLQQLQTSPILLCGLSIYHPSILRDVCVCVSECMHTWVYTYVCVCVCVHAFVKFPKLSPWFCPECKLALAFSEVAILQTLVGHLQKSIVSGPSWFFLMRAQGKYEEVRCLQGMHIVNSRP